MTTNLETPGKLQLKSFLKDLNQLLRLPTQNKYKRICIPEYPFDHQLLTASPIYRQSRNSYRKLGGVFSPRVTSTMRGLSAQDLFKNEIDFTPSLSEMVWFASHPDDVVDPNEEYVALSRFSEISVFHEQNHRVIWQLLPPAPSEKRDLCRYLNFAESLVVTLDLALGDELGLKVSPVFERMKVIYRDGGRSPYKKASKKVYRQYLLSLLCATYFILELIHTDDILKALDYIFPGQKKMNRLAFLRSLEINELFTRVTNPLWQERYWKIAAVKLKKLQVHSAEQTLYLPEDPLDLEEEFVIAARIFDYYGI